ncbi:MULTISPECIES: hypothetical protein [unclassified Moorena]|uniref:hypothetical protein n=1 Tax=unclassified Moorena TaxID=2683338 RepID=UPI0025FF4471|nr:MULTISPECIES: hypothetical protein [unclassified Moorena]
MIVIVVEGKVKISFDSLLPTPYSLLPTPYSLLPTPYSLLPTPYSLLPTPLANQNCNLYLTCTSLNT